MAAPKTLGDLGAEQEAAKEAAQQAASELQEQVNLFSVLTPAASEGQYCIQTTLGNLEAEQEAAEEAAQQAASELQELVDIPCFRSPAAGEAGRNPLSCTENAGQSRGAPAGCVWASRVGQGLPQQAGAPGPSNTCLC